MLKFKDLSTEEFCRGLTNPQQFTPEQRTKKSGLKISNEVFSDVLARALAVSPECKSKIIDLATAGKTENELLRAITDMASGREVTSTSRNRQGGAITSFDQITDEEFFAGFSRPLITAFTA